MPPSCSVIAGFRPPSGTYLPQYLRLDATPDGASGTYDTCSRPLQLFWDCQSSSSTECPNFLAQANTNGNTNYQPVPLLGELETIFITLKACVAGTNECSPTVLRTYVGAAVNTFNNSGSSYREVRRGEAARKFATTQAANQSGVTAIAAGNFHSLALKNLSLPQQVTQVITQVQDLVTAGVLSADQGAGLITRLNGFIARLNGGQVGAACNQLNAFIYQVNGFISAGSLSEAQGQALFDEANNIKANIGC
jgi:hypothetical protein